MISKVNKRLIELIMLGQKQGLTSSEFNEMLALEKIMDEFDNSRKEKEYEVGE